MTQTRMPRSIGYLGPAGTNCEEALRSQSDLEMFDPLPCVTITDVISAVAQDEVDRGIIPIENSVEGTVNVAVDCLAFQDNLVIEREIVRPVSMQLVAQPGTTLADIKEVTSHPHAIAQCRTRLSELLPGTRIIAANSTAEAAQDVAKNAGAHRSAVSTALAAETYGLDTLVSDIGDRPDAETRYVLLGREVPKRTGADKTSIAVFLAENSPGSLLSILQEFAVRELNLTKIESRPMKGRLGEYFFMIDFEGHLADAFVRDALRDLHYRFGKVRFLGSYPRARGSARFEKEKEEARWAAAGSWIEDLQGRMQAQ